MIIKKNIFNILSIFLILHLVIWTLIPALTNINLPLDTIEHLAWASNLDWGFNKHPPLVAFVLYIFYFSFGNQDWVYYFLSQIFILVSFFVVFKFADEFLNSKILAFLSVLLLEGFFFYNFTSPEFNVNVCQLPLWALSIYFTYRCITFNKKLDYLFLGLFIGLGILTKYLFIYLVVGIKLLFLFYFFYYKKRKKFSSINFLITGLVALLIITPHLIWLLDNNFVTVSYGLQRAGENKSLINHIINPLIFLGKQLVILIPIFLMLFFLIKKFKFNFNLKDKKLIFLIFTTLIPIFLILLTSIIMGAKIRTMWMTPFYLFFGVLLIYIFQSVIIKKNYKKFLIVFFFFFLTSPSIYLAVSLIDNTKRTDFPGAEISRLVQNKWDKNFLNEIKFVIGDEWYAGNLSYHLSSRPKWLLTFDEKKNDLNIDGGVIYTGNPKVLKKICPGVYGTIKPVGYCMIGQK